MLTMITLKLKICSRCKKELPLDAFGKNSKSKDGLMWWCASCMEDYVLARYKDNSKYRANIIARANTHRSEYLPKTFVNYRKRNPLKIKDIARTTFFLSRSGIRETLWIRANEKCELCGRSIRKTRGNSNYAIHHLDHDRKNNSLENLIVVCTPCHLQKLHSSVPTIKL